MDQTGREGKESIRSALGLHTFTPSAACHRNKIESVPGLTYSLPKWTPQQGMWLILTPGQIRACNLEKYVVVEKPSMTSSTYHMQSGRLDHDGHIKKRAQLRESSLMRPLVCTYYGAMIASLSVTRPQSQKILTAQSLTARA
jgi:hypothetical protein